MKTVARWRASSASDAGLMRNINEDRVWFDETRGIFLVVDGLGGHAAGETAAATAVAIVSEHLDPSVQDLEAHIKAVICAANNEIYRLAEENPAWHGMACVLTLAVMQENEAVIGHVGDSRLYIFSNGGLRKITSDHSPVGEQEDQGLLTEEEAMHHPRRNEVFRDVGSSPRLSTDEQFIETQRFVVPDNAALLLCSDGLSDLVTAAEMSAILEQFDGDPNRTAQQLIEAANAAGGRDNISVVFVAAPDFTGIDSRISQNARLRHATTRPRSETSKFPAWVKFLLIALGVAALSIAGWQVLSRPSQIPTALQKQQIPIAQTQANIIDVNPTDARGVIDALQLAVSGDTISVPPGEFLGPIMLKEGVNIKAKLPHQSVIRCDPAATSEQGLGLVARGVQTGVISGLKIAADETHPIKTGILLVDSSVELRDLEVTGAIYSGIRMEGVSKPVLAENFIHGNGGAGISIGDTSSPTLIHNQVIQNGLVVTAVRPGIEIGPAAKPVLDGNLVSGNGADEPLKTGHAESKKRKGER